MSKKVKMYYGGTAMKHVAHKDGVHLNLQLTPGLAEYDSELLDAHKDSPAMKKLVEEKKWMSSEDYEKAVKGGSPAKSEPAKDEKKDDKKSDTKKK